MNKICVVTKNPDTYFVKRLTEEVGESIVLFNPWTDFLFPEVDLYLSRCSGVYGSDLDLMFLKSVPKNRLVNNIDVLNLFRSKSIQYEWFEKEDIPSLPWLPVKGVDLLTIEKFFRLYPELIVKPIIGQGGWGVEKITWPQFKSWKKKKGTDQDYLLQPFIKEATEYRYFFIKGRSPIIFERKIKSGFAANFKNQGEAFISELPQSAQHKLKQLETLSGAHYGAIDLLIKENQVIVLELNVVPGIEQLEKVSGINVIKELLESFSLLNHEGSVPKF